MGLISGPNDAAPSIADDPFATQSAAVECRNPLQTQLPPAYRPLTGAQYAAVLRTVFRRADAAVDAMPNPWSVSEASSKYTTDATSLKLSQLSVETLLDGTSEIAAAARDEIMGQFPCLRDSSGDRNCRESVVDGTLTRLYNGPIVTSEREAKVDYLAQLLEDFSRELALDTFFSTVMMSPRVLHRTEIGVDNGDGTSTLTAREMAEALSFAISGGRPDAALLSAIEDGDLSVEEMLEHGQRLARTAASIGPERFVSEFMTIKGLDGVIRSDGDEGALPDAVKAALRVEAEAFIRRAVRSGGSVVHHLLTSETALASPLTLPLHNVEEGEVTPDEDGFYVLDASRRPGLMLQPAMMALLSHEGHTDPVQRGNFVLSRFLCFNLPPAPPDIPALDLSPGDTPMTVRERLKITHQDPSCQTCHQYMDGIGFSFEAFDHLGRERALELGRPVDTSGSVNIGVASVDGELENAQELVRRLSAAGEVQTCVATHAFSYLSGFIADTSLDTCLFEANGTIAEETGGDIVAGFVRILSSPMYRVRHSNRVSG